MVRDSQCALLLRDQDTHFFSHPVRVMTWRVIVRSRSHLHSQKGSSDSFESATSIRKKQLEKHALTVDCTAVSESDSASSSMPRTHVCHVRWMARQQEVISLAIKTAVCV
jgi:hypothetical protein